MELFLHNKIFEEQTLWWNIYSVTSELCRSYMANTTLRARDRQPVID
jgi:hypothetical protein